MSTPPNTQHPRLDPDACVLVVGAGPTGLTAAAFLDRQSIAFDLIDPKHGAVSDSRALGIHARTLEFMAMLGLDGALLERGHKTRYMTFHRGARRLFRLDFACIRHLTRYPFMLVLPQRDSESILIEHLAKRGRSIAWGSRLLGFEQFDSHVSAEILHEDGRRETRTYDYLIGCDGAASLVRNVAGIEFDGTTYDARFLLCEVEIEGSAVDRRSSHVFMGKKTTVAVIPQPGGIFRVVGPDFSRANEGSGIVSRNEVTFEDFSTFLAANRLLQHVSMGRPSRMVSYRVHKRVASRFREGRVFIAGDAAHIHSPAGGQGMNTGLHDVANLSWRIAQVLHGLAAPNVLDGYDPERRPAALTIVNGADNAMMRVVSRTPMARLFFDWIAPVLTKVYQPRWLMSALAQIRYTYPGFEMAGAGHLPDGLRPGQRIPDLPLRNGRSLFTYFGTEREVVVLSSRRAEVESTSALRNLATGRDIAVLARPLPGRLPGRRFEGVLLCRPDGFIAAAIPHQRSPETRPRVVRTPA